ncbi:MAG: anaerobic sulfatase maturase [Verrucomicrobiae bacterium]|nr:anaerobic sulfatase maturase [Verrucomicrobiae bacterium]MDW8343434.1 anaerobic sulfatase maturase [Verrucomicrobiae bacterium]
MIKPVGPICNLDCRYCFYLEKEKLFSPTENFRMPDAVLERFIQHYIESQPVPVITFAWQGGEPTLLGVDFFRKAVALQQRYANGKRIENALQTNGVLLDDEWGAFLAENQFLVGLSVDGPRELHDRYRVDKKQQPTFDRVMRGLEVLKKHHVEFNTLTVVHRHNARHPLEVYRFLKDIGSRYLQFIPLVERLPDAEARALGLDLAGPPSPDAVTASSEVTRWSVLPEDYGEFLVHIFDEWVRQDVGQVFVQLFDVALANWMGEPPGLCVFMERCGAAVAMEHNGDVYSCDHYVYPHYRLGNVLNASLGEMVQSAFQQKFGRDKSDTLPAYCRRCDVRFACHGECPKHRFLRTPDGEPGLNYLCAAYKRFFHHIDPFMRRMTQLIQSGLPAAHIMFLTARRNDPCPCGSGRKFKQCCWDHVAALRAGRSCGNVTKLVGPAGFEPATKGL